MPKEKLNNALWASEWQAVRDLTAKIYDKKKTINDNDNICNGEVILIDVILDKENAMFLDSKMIEEISKLANVSYLGHHELVYSFLSQKEYVDIKHK